MPKNDNFNILSKTLNVVFPTVGVLMSAQGETEDATLLPILGAYYDTSEEFQGLYIPTVSGDVQYFDIDVVNISNAGDAQMIRFDVEDINYLIRPIYTEDGQWYSKYKIDLPKSVIESKFSTDSVEALKKFAGIDLGEIPAFFESLYAYASDRNKNIIALNYVSSAGVYSRVGAQWVETEIGLDMYEDLYVIEIDADGARALLDSFDSNGGKLLVEDATKSSVNPE